MRTTQRGIDLIKRFEGLRLKAYKPVKTEKYYTIGYGHYGADVTEGMVITEQQAEELLRKDLQKFENGVSDLTKGVELKPQQFDALVSFAYNVGLGAFEKSTLLRKVKNNPNDWTIKSEFLKWRLAGGKVLEGLVKRRQAEAGMYFS